MTTDADRLRIPPFRVLLDGAMRPTRRFFTAIYPAVAIPVIVAVAIQTVLQTLVMADFFRGMAQAESDPKAFFVSWLGIMGLSLVFVVVYMVASTVVLAAACDATASRPVDMGRTWRWAFSPRVFGTTLMTWLVIGIGMMCCLLPGILLWVLLAFVVPVMALEERFGTAAWSRSYQLVAHNPGGSLASHPGLRVLAIGVVTVLLSYLVSLIVSLPFVIVQQVLLYRSATENPAQLAQGASMPTGWLWLQVPQTVLSQLANMAIWIYAGFVVARLFEALRGLKEGTDLEAALDELGAPDPTEPVA